MPEYDCNTTTEHCGALQPRNDTVTGNDYGNTVAVPQPITEHSCGAAIDYGNTHYGAAIGCGTISVASNYIVLGTVDYELSSFLDMQRCAFTYPRHPRTTYMC